MRRAGMVVFSSVTANGNPPEFTTADSVESLETATVEPPPPFQGSASSSSTPRHRRPGVERCVFRSLGLAQWHLPAQPLVGSLQGKRLHQDPAPQCPGHFLGSCRPSLRKRRPSRLRDSDPLETGALSSPMSARWAVSCPASPRSRATSGERFASRRSLTRQPRRARALAPRPLCAGRFMACGCRPTSSSSALGMQKTGRTCVAASSTPLCRRVEFWPADGRPQASRRQVSAYYRRILDRARGAILQVEFTTEGRNHRLRGGHCWRQGRQPRRFAFTTGPRPQRDASLRARRGRVAGSPFAAVPLARNAPQSRRSRLATAR